MTASKLAERIDAILAVHLASPAQRAAIEVEIFDAIKDYTHSVLERAGENIVAAFREKRAGESILEMR